MGQVQAGCLIIPDPAFAAEQFFALCQTRIGLLKRLELMSDIDETLLRQVVESTVTMFLNTYGAKP